MAVYLPLFDIRMRRRRQPRVFRQRMTLDDVRDIDIKSKYRLDRERISLLEDTLHDDLVSDTQISFSIPPITKILVGLRYLSKADFLSEAAELHGISKASAAVVVDEFVSSLNRRVDNISFPLDRLELDSVKLKFFRRCGIPNVVGAVDGTLVHIIAPSLHPDVYICRKGYHALNIQAVVDSDMRFRDVVCKWSESQHDAAIFDSCGLKMYLEESHIGHLLGDSSYALKRYLLTPVMQPARQEETAYNAAHSKGRCVVECAFGVLKARFRCLHRSGGVLPFTPGKSARVVMACMRLHNMCVDAGLQFEEEFNYDNGMNDEIYANQENQGAVRYRQNIIDTL